MFNDNSTRLGDYPHPMFHVRLNITASLSTEICSNNDHTARNHSPASMTNVVSRVQNIPPSNGIEVGDRWLDSQVLSNLQLFANSLTVAGVLRERRE